MATSKRRGGSQQEGGGDGQGEEWHDLLQVVSFARYS